MNYAANGVDVTDTTKLFTMGTRDGSKPSIHEHLLFEPGEYILGVANGSGGGTYRPPVDSIGFDNQGGTDDVASTAAGAYRLTIREGSSLNLIQGVESRSTKESAQPVRLGSQSAALHQSADSWYRIDISETDASQAWDILGQVPVGRRTNALLYANGDTQIAKTSSDSKGKFSFRDLGLEPGSYFVALNSPDSGYIRTLIATSVGQRIEGAEAEPNDSWQFANRADLSQPVTGRMGKSNENDFFSFSLDESTADQVLALQLETATETKMQLCLTNHQGRQIQCRSGNGRVELPDLVLAPGDWGFVVGRGAEGAAYSVALSEHGVIAAGIEAEPNDTIEFAAAVPGNNRIKGRFSGSDTDFFKILVTDEPQLWRFQVIGDELFELAYNDGAGIQSQVYRAQPGNVEFDWKTCSYCLACITFESLAVMAAITPCSRVRLAHPIRTANLSPTMTQAACSHFAWDKREPVYSPRR